MEILYEDNHLVVVNKNNSDLVQGDRTGDQALDSKVRQWLKEKYRKPGNVFLGVVHRLDRPVSGAVVFAKTSKALARMNQLFQKKAVDKTYWAVVKNKPNPPSGELRHYMVRNPRKNKSFALDQPRRDAREAGMSYQLMASSDHYHLLEITIQTGRHHQIRSQLSKIGAPIKGDLKYGFPRSNTNGGISLHARQIGFIHPVQKKYISFTAAPPPDNLWNYFLERLSNSSSRE